MRLHNIEQFLQTYIIDNIFFQAMSAVLSIYSAIQTIIEYYDREHKGKSLMQAVLIVVAFIYLSKWMGLFGAAFVLTILGFIAVYHKRVNRHEDVQSILVDGKDKNIQNMIEDAELVDEYSVNVLRLQNHAFIEAEKCLAERRPRAAISWLNRCNDRVRGQTRYSVRFADALIALGNYAGALAKLEALPKKKLRKSRNLKRILVRKGICFHALNQYARELECYDQIIKNNYKPERYYYHRGRVKVRILEVAPYIKSAEKMIAENYDSKQIFVDSTMEDFDSSLKICTRYEAEIMSYKGACFYHIQEKSKSLGLLNDSMEKDDCIANTYVYLGILTYEEDDLEKGIEYFEKAIEYDKLDDKAYFYLSKIYYRQGNYDEAVRYASAAISLFPYRDDSYAVIGDCCRKQEMYNDAIIYYTKAIERKPKADYYNSRGTCYYNKSPSDAKKAYEDAKACLDLCDSEHYRIKYAMCMSNVDRKEGRKREEQEIDQLVLPFENIEKYANEVGLIYKHYNCLEKAAEYFKKAIAYSRHSIAPKYNLSLILRNQEQFEEAAKLLEEALEEGTQDIKYYDDLLECYKSMGDVANEARTEIRKHELKKKYMERYKQQGDAVYRLEKYAEAEKYYQQALEQIPNEPLLLNRIASTYYGREEYQTAISYLEKAINQKPDCYQAHFNLGNCYLRIAQSADQRRMAEQCYRRAREIQPEFEPAVKMLESMNITDARMVL